MRGMTENSKEIKISKKCYRFFDKPLNTTQKKLVEENLPIVDRILYMLTKSQYIKSSVEREDLIQAGRLGLCVAAKNFDDSRGVKFTSFAWPYVRGYIIHYLRDNTRVVRVPQKIISDRIAISKLEKLNLSENQIMEQLSLTPLQFWDAKLSHLEDYVSI
jgi:RNA polymerase sigma factor (sigma-70 family)